MKKKTESLDVGPFADLKAFFSNSSHNWKFAALAVAIPAGIGALFWSEEHKIPYRPPDLTYVRMEAGPGEDDTKIRAFHDAQAAELAALQAKAEKQKKDNMAAAKRIDDSLKSWHLK